LVRHPVMQNPTLVVLTDRNDLAQTVAVTSG
jgi:type I site-specific restriction-modification system R (restriction) subunit